MNYKLNYQSKTANYLCILLGFRFVGGKTSLMIEKIVKAKKEHTCTRCGGIIRKGNLYKYYSGRQPKFADDNETQIGIEFFTDRTCLSDKCDGMLKHVNDPKKYLQKCAKGLHEYEQSYEFDHYADCHRVYVPTGDYLCVNCGVDK